MTVHFFPFHNSTIFINMIVYFCTSAYPNILELFIISFHCNKIKCSLLDFNILSLEWQVLNVNRTSGQVMKVIAMKFSVYISISMNSHQMAAQFKFFITWWQVMKVTSMKFSVYISISMSCHQMAAQFEFSSLDGRI